MPMIDSGFYNMDCMEGMKQFPDNFFDLAIVDPPYGINVASHRTHTMQFGKYVGDGKIIGGGTEDSAARNVYGAARSCQASLNPTIPSRMTVRPMKVILENWRG